MEKAKRTQISRREAASKVSVETVTRKPSKQLEDKWKIIRKVTEQMLSEFSSLEAGQVNLRLNRSNTNKLLPVFIDWLGIDNVSGELVKKSGVQGKKTDWGYYRLGDGVFSKVYDEAVTNVLKQIVEREWSEKALTEEKKVESQRLVQKAGLNYQKFIGIIAGEKGKPRCVGTLTVSFQKKPSSEKLAQIDEKMKKWASWPANPKSNLVETIENNFVLGGPFVKDG